MVVMNKTRSKYVISLIVVAAIQCATPASAKLICSQAYLKTDRNNACEISNQSFYVEDYGAKGNCVDDDAHAVNSAIKAAAETVQGGGIVRMPRSSGKCYLVKSPIEFPGSISNRASSNIRLIGDGVGVTVIRAGADMEAVVRSSTIYNRGHAIENLTLDAAGLSDYSFHQRSGSQFHLDRVYFLNGRVSNVLMQGYENFIRNSLFWNQEEVFPLYNIQPPFNLEVRPENRKGASDNHFENNVFFNARIANIYDEYGGNNHFINNHAYGYPKSRYPQFNFIANAASLWMGNTADGAKEAGFQIDSDEAHISSNRVQLAPVGIRIRPGTKRLIVTDNIVSGADSNTAIYAPFLGSDSIVRNNTGQSSNAIDSISKYIGDKSFKSSNKTVVKQTSRLLHQQSIVGDVILSYHQDELSVLGTANKVMPYGHLTLQVRAVVTAACKAGEMASWKTDFSVFMRGEASSMRFVDATGRDNAPKWEKISSTPAASGWKIAAEIDNKSNNILFRGYNTECADRSIVDWLANINVDSIIFGTDR